MNATNFSDQTYATDDFRIYIEERAHLMLEHMEQVARGQHSFDPVSLLDEEAVGREVLVMVCRKNIELQLLVDEQQLVRVARDYGPFSEREILRRFPLVPLNQAYRLRLEAHDYARTVYPDDPGLRQQEAEKYLSLRLGIRRSQEAMNDNGKTKKN